MPGSQTEPLQLKGWSNALTDTEGPLTRAANAQLRNLPGRGDPLSLLRLLSNLPAMLDTASDAANAAFPDSARDSSMKNAYRHSLGTGLLAQQLKPFGVIGGNSIPAALAKLGGYGWESGHMKQNLQDPASMTDALHDLNANAIGAEVAPHFRTPEELSLYLLRKALQSRVAQPPGARQLSPGYMTRTEE